MYRTSRLLMNSLWLVIALTFSLCAGALRASTCAGLSSMIPEKAREFVEHSEETALESDTILYQVTPIQKDFILGWDGTVYKKIAFESSLEKYFAIRLRDSHRAHEISKRYYEMIFPGLKEPHIQAEFDHWLRDQALFFGCPKRLAGKLQRHPMLSQYAALFDRTFSCVDHSHEKPIHVVHRPRRIVILTTSCAGGELMVADCIKNYLKKCNFEVFCVDCKKVLRPHDIFLRYSGIQHEEIYSEIFQKENNRPLAYRLTNLADAIRDFVPDDSYVALKQCVKQFEPDLILDTVFCFPYHVALAYDLNVPMRFVHSDFQFSLDLLPLLDTVDPSLVKFWVPANYEECFPESLHDCHDRIEVLGSPLRAKIVRESNPEKLAAIRQRLSVAPDAQVVLLMMGRQGVGKMLDYVKLLDSTDRTFAPLHLAVLCGMNQALKREIEEYLHGRPRHKNLRISVHSFLEEADMADWYNIAHVLVGQTGGTTVAELLAMNVYALITDSYFWTECNTRYLSSWGLASRLGSQGEFIDKLFELLSRKKASIPIRPVDWTKNIVPLVNRACEARS